MASHTSVIAPLKKEAKGSAVIFNFNNSLLFTNGNKIIKTLTANLGDGVTRSIIRNSVLNAQSIGINYTTTGDKKLTFNITYSDNSVLTTYGNFYFSYENSSAPAKTSTCNGETLADDFSIISDTAFKGYTESFAFKGKFDYRIFYRTKNGNTERKIRKPIIIIDGFDPGDKRKISSCEMTNYKPGETFSIQDMMTYTKTVNGEITRQDLIKELRNKGYDVTIINHPTYSVSKTAPYNVVDSGSSNSQEVNGGADYIERNALTLATLIKNFNAQLKANGSTEKLTIVGPSMGGQTSRYALAHLEKLGIDHNTSLWISIDSPHLGANIPLGDQALVNLLKTVANNVSAADFYDNQLGSPAARQQIIEFHRDNPDHHRVNVGYLNGRTVSQGFTSSSGNPFYQQFYTNQFANGLPNSKGYPQNLRKIALVNGSLTGKTIGSDSEKVLNIRGFQRIHIPLLIGSITFTIHIASLESHFMPTYNIGTQRISRFKKAFDDRTTIAPNVNSRGNMDTVPGGWFPAQNDIAKSVLSNAPIPTGGSFWHNPIGNISDFFGGSYFELRDFRFNHSFIPTFSALGHLQPNQNWANSLNFNLTCTTNKLTPFDSYYGAAENTQHTSFTEESVNWLMKELDGQPQAPWFPIEATQFNGSSAICINATSSYSFPDPCKLPSDITWSLNNTNAQIVSSTGSSVNLKGITSGSVILTATFQNGQILTKTIWVGLPKFHIEPDPSNSTNYVTFNAITEPSNISFEQMGVADTNIVWKRLDNGQTRTGASYFAHAPGHNWSFEVEVKATNSCGTYTTYATITPPPAMPCETFTLAETNQNNNYTILKSVDPDCPINNGKTTETYQITVANSMGVIIISKIGDSFDLSTYPTGMYVVNIQKDNQVIINQTLIKN